MSARDMLDKEEGPENQLSLLHSQQHLTENCCHAADKTELNCNIPPTEAVSRG